jgi:tetratricopeptide (TPR) repeat protein
VKTLLLLLLAALALFPQTNAPHIKAALSAYELGNAAVRNHRVDAALNSFRKAIQIEPTFMEARRALIETLLSSGNRLEAAAAITRFLEIEPDANRYRVVLGRILLEQKQPSRALAQFSILLESEPDNADGLLGFAAAAKQAGMQSQAVDALKRGASRYPADRRFRQELNSR